MIPADTAHDTVEALGEIGLLQFKDLNVEKSAFQRTYANQVCEPCWLTRWGGTRRVDFSHHPDWTSAMFGEFITRYCPGQSMGFGIGLGPAGCTDRVVT